ncbi:MAG: NADH-quinone oxidoreductase subunit J [Pirellulales bacterium]|nr:NADH-quinone oxidoreductase subunit J [Pirellulales bacterium]
MNHPQWILVAATLLGAVAMWLLLPRVRDRGWPLGIVLGAIGLGLLASQMPRIGHWTTDSVFLVLAAVTVVAAVATVTFRNPVYSAIWFGLSLLGTAGLFLVQGAAFLAVATVIVYAGAILVTFLFLLMLADPQGRAYYDRIGWETSLSAFAGAVIVGILSMTTISVLTNPSDQLAAAAATDQQRAEGVLGEYPIAGLGSALFGTHLIAVEVAGALLLAALVGAAAIVAHGRVKPPPEIPEKGDPAAARQTGQEAAGDGEPASPTRTHAAAEHRR